MIGSLNSNFVVLISFYLYDFIITEFINSTILMDFIIIITITITIIIETIMA